MRCHMSGDETSSCYILQTVFFLGASFEGRATEFRGGFSSPTGWCHNVLKTMSHDEKCSPIKRFGSNPPACLFRICHHNH
jgi:hypothetical protein